MPTNACSTAAQLTADQRVRIVKSLTETHAVEANAPRYFVQVVFYGIAPDSHFIGGERAPAGQIWIRADIRAGRTQQQKTRMLNRILDEVSEIMHVSKEEVWVYISDIPAESVAEYGRPLPPPGQENDWLATLPEVLKEKLAANI